MAEIRNEDDSPQSLRRGDSVGEMHARREKMADGRRYIIYYTFGEQAKEPKIGDKEGASENV